MKIVQLLTLLFFSTSILSQSTGKVRLIVSPPNSIIKLDGQLIDSSNKSRNNFFELEEGSHSFEVWAPYMELEKHDVIVVSDSTMLLKVVLKKESDFLAYRNEIKSYYRGKTLSWGVISGATILAVGSSYYLFNPKIRKDFKAAEIDLEGRKDKYESSFGVNEVAEARKNYIAAKKNTEKAQRKNIAQKAIGIPLTLASIGAVYWSIKRLKKEKATKKKPTYQINNPFSEVKISPEVESIGMNTYTGFSLKLSF